MEIKQEINLSITYNIPEVPDKVSGRCGNCNNAQFKRSIKDIIFLLECRNCGIKKII